ncbi:AAA family ATPase [Bacillus anthracis]|uniref:AAA family ATPase n=1 Tax=Bacillus anthracis TaxID=1392 RepID=UPI003D21F6C1
MELLYVWIEGFNEGLMKEQGFNFDSRFKYQLHPMSDGIHRLSIKDNPNHLEGFFQPEYSHAEPMAVINNITAIVGQNGAGKSSIMDFLKENFGGNDEEEDIDEIEEDIRYLYILRKYKDEKLEHYIYKSPNMRIDINVNKEMNFFYELRIDNVGFPRNIDNTTLIYFSNVYDNKNEYSKKKLLNISTNYLSSGQFQRDNLSLTGDYKFDEVKRQIEFVHWINNIEVPFTLPFKFPNSVDVVIRERMRGNMSVFQTTGEYPLLDSIKSIYKSVNTHKVDGFKLSDNKADRKVIVFLTRVILRHIASEIRREKVRDKLRDFDIELLQEETDCNDDFIRLSRGLQRVAYLIDDINEELLLVSKMLKALATFMMNFYTDYLHNSTVGEVSYHSIKLTFKIEELKSGRLKDILNLYEDLSMGRDFITFSWRDMSSGEKALLNIYSRFYYVSNQPELVEHFDDDLIILIDEGEVYLHPHWQGNLLNSLIEFLPIVFKNKKELRQRNIQVILTSNSPFLVSDLPSANIIFLRKEQSQTTVMEELGEDHRTFAANIHTLLAHSFFMEDGVTGAFAKRKINEIIHLLIKGDIVTIFENEEKIEKTINLIGEPVIRNKLLQMLAERRMTGVNKEIARLNLRLKKLEKWQDDKN